MIGNCVAAGSDYEGKHAMRCKCGYDFGKKRLDECRTGVRQFTSYAVVNHEDYKTFLKLEVKVLKCRTERTKLAAIARSAEYVGCLLECPQCARLVLLRPEPQDTEDGPEYYRKDE